MNDGLAYTKDMFPLEAIKLDTPLDVVAIRSRGNIKAGVLYKVTWVRRTGDVIVANHIGETYPMDLFQRVTLATAPVAANQNAKR